MIELLGDGPFPVVDNLLGSICVYYAVSYD